MGFFKGNYPQEKLKKKKKKKKEAFLECERNFGDCDERYIAIASTEFQ